MDGRETPKKLGREIIGEMEQRSSRDGMKEVEGLDKECGKKREEGGKKEVKWDNGNNNDKEMEEGGKIPKKAGKLMGQRR